MIDRIQLSTTDGETLEARWDRSESPAGVVVFCHPHPQQGGTMMAPLMVAVTTPTGRSEDSRCCVSTSGGSAHRPGQHDNGKAEVLDVAAAIGAAHDTGLTVHLSGWSFGAGMALRWLSGQQDLIPYAGIAPPPRTFPMICPRAPSGSWSARAIRSSISKRSAPTPSVFPSIWSSPRATISSMVGARRSATWWHRVSKPVQTDLVMTDRPVTPGSSPPLVCQERKPEPCPSPRDLPR